MGVISAVAPSTRPIFAMFEPIALPVASPVFPWADAMAATSISGADVPRPTMVRPIINGGIPKFRAMAEVPLTKKSAEKIKKVKPAKSAAMLISICVRSLV